MDLSRRFTGVVASADVDPFHSRELSLHVLAPSLLIPQHDRRPLAYTVDVFGFVEDL